MLNLASILEDAARNVPDRDAVVLGETRLTYAQVDAAANQVANLLVSRGVEPGDKVALSCPNLPYFPIVYHGILKAGAVVVPLNVLLKGREIAYHLEDSDAVAYFCFEGSPELPMGTDGKAGFDQVESCRDMFVITADPRAESPLDGVETMAQATAQQPPTFDSAVTGADDTAIILYTSGTTGQPKGAELTHSNMLLNALANTRLFGRPEKGHDTMLVVLPLFHSFGQTVLMNGGFAEHATLVMQPRFEPYGALQLMTQHEVTFFAGVPTMYWGLIGALDPSIDVDGLRDRMRVAISGGSSLPVEIIREFKARFGLDIKEGYGLSETAPVASFTPPGTEPVPGSIGKPIWAVDMKLVDPEWNEITDPDAVGEIAVKGYNIMKGYYDRPEATAAVMNNGWFRTGDLGRKDSDGYYYIVDRTKDLIIRGGYNVYPREVEEVLMTHEAVSLAAVVGVAHPSHGEEVKAFVILQPGAQATPEELVAWSKENMAGHKYPRIVEIRDSLPMTATGKILKRELA